MKTFKADSDFLQLLNFGIRRYIGIAQTKYKLADSKKIPLRATISKINEALEKDSYPVDLEFDNNTFEIHKEAIRISHQFSRDPNEKDEMARLYKLFTAENI